MSISRLKTTLLASVLALAGSAHAATLINEKFDAVSVTPLATAGWVITNASSPAGSTSWFETNDGNPLSTGDHSAGYAGANYNSGVSGGLVDDWLITPAFSTADAGHVTLWFAADDQGYVDTVKFGFSNGGSATSAFTMGSVVVGTGTWTEYTFAYAAGGAGSTARFAIEYTGASDSLDAVGIDNLSVTSVPEPATWALFALGGLALLGRRRAAR